MRLVFSVRWSLSKACIKFGAQADNAVVRNSLLLTLTGREGLVAIIGVVLTFSPEFYREWLLG